MFDWLRRFKILVEFEGVDQHGDGVEGTGKVSYIGVGSKEDVTSYFTTQALVEHGLRITSCRVIGQVRY